MRRSRALIIIVLGAGLAALGLILGIVAATAANWNALVFPLALLVLGGWGIVFGIRAWQERAREVAETERRARLEPPGGM